MIKVFCQMKQKVEECIMVYAQEEYTRHYIITALFKLMSDYDYGEISVTDIAKKAGVGRAIFYRYFKKKEYIIIYYFNVYTTYLYAGMLFNISMRWLDNNCDEDEKKLAEIIVNAIYK